MSATVYLIPTVLHEGATQCLPAYLLDAIKACRVFYVENERTARRFLKSIWKEMVIDDYGWHNMKELTSELRTVFLRDLQAGHTVGILSEAGCPGVADPGQLLVHLAQGEGALVKPLVGPSSILLALMASGMNGQQFRFNGYLPIEAGERQKAIRALESDSRKNNCTEIFIETPYRNNQLLEVLLKTCAPQTLICVAVDLTGPQESVQTKTPAQWRASLPELHKRPAIFLLFAAG
ncbi:SAM-dependent methyltransferase [Flaviaesturariibacter aridisoli]|uniref:SAM-dependent methyltransferase n=1 Tax=Flaviaesturariibacter aridisoli TaxID=2545761 RepID=A0A4R4E5M7_9BACT|nr:SAM-dependent methyltransferase [Flaviaesturariibacter aridisoli]TCZ74946.1 SAM-dependent methyltransferase [Flaviaesturariibacter aridisoli]